MAHVTIFWHKTYLSASGLGIQKGSLKQGTFVTPVPKETWFWNRLWWIWEKTFGKLLKETELWLKCTYTEVIYNLAIKN